MTALLNYLALFFGFVNEIFALNLPALLQLCTNIISCSKNEMLENALFNHSVYWILLNKRMFTFYRVVKAKRCCGCILQLSDRKCPTESIIPKICKISFFRRSYLKNKKGELF